MPRIFRFIKFIGKPKKGNLKNKNYPLQATDNYTKQNMSLRKKPTNTCLLTFLSDHNNIFSRKVLKRNKVGPEEKLMVKDGAFLKKINSLRCPGGGGGCGEQREKNLKQAQLEMRIWGGESYGNRL